jgi:ABC-type antimicrobial peptide transport system permease subunit
MKFLAFVVFMVILLVMGMVGGLLTASPALTSVSFCSFTGVVFPLLWVAVYRLYQTYEIRVGHRR